MVARTDGTLYFIDPPFGDVSPGVRRMPYNAVWRLGPDGELDPQWRGDWSTRPNGIALSHDERALFITDTANEAVLIFAVDPATGGLEQPTEFVRVEGTPDGLAVDAAGNVYVATSNGVEVFSSDARQWGRIAVGGARATNVAFGGVHGRTLFISTATGVGSVELCIPGRP